MDLLELVLDHARAAPDSPTAKDPTTSVTFAELVQRVGDLAGGLANQGVGEGDRVALDLPNSVDFFVAALASMWVGAIFVPLAAPDPFSRRAAIVENCDPRLVLRNEPSGPSRQSDAEVLGRPVFSARELAELGVPAPDRVEDEDRAAYCIYTSGTTGTPKGVLIGHAALLSSVLATAERLELTEATRALCVSPFYFDGSYGTLFPVPAAGGSLVIPRRETLMLPRLFFKLVAAENINHTSMSPSYLRLLLSSPHFVDLADTSLRTMALGGEALLPSDLERLWAAAPEIRVFNRYGPTETTIAVTTHEVSPGVVRSGDPVPIGAPHRGVSFVVVDDNGQIVDGTGLVGELHIGGTHLMMGYWREPELTAEVMRTDVVEGSTLYRTSDLVTRDAAGDYLYVDRADRVVKRSGVRISLTEITVALTRLASISMAHCVLFDNAGLLGIAAFVVAPAELTGNEIRHAARDLLPATMLPDAVEIVADLPMTASSKVDERALLAAAGLKEWTSERGH